MRKSPHLVSLFIHNPLNQGLKPWRDVQKDYKFSIEYFDKSIEDSLKRAKFEIKEYGAKDE